MLDIGQLAAQVRLSQRDRPRILVGIDGPGGTGKSTLAALLAAAIADTAVVHVDDFYLPSALQGSRDGQVGLAFDLPRLADQVIKPAALGHAVRYQRYDWPTDALAEWIDIPGGAPVIVEGVFCLHAHLRDAYTYTIFCRATPQVRLRRGLERDGERARQRWLEEWMPAEDTYVAQERPDAAADLVIDTSAGTPGEFSYHVVARNG